MTTTIARAVLFGTHQEGYEVAVELDKTDGYSVNIYRPDPRHKEQMLDVEIRPCHSGLDRRRTSRSGAWRS